MQFQVGLVVMGGADDDHIPAGNILGKGMVDFAIGEEFLQNPGEGNIHILGDPAAQGLGRLIGNDYFIVIYGGHGRIR